MKFLELKNELKKDVAPVYLISGNDEFLISQAILTLKETLVKGFDEFNYSKLDVSGFNNSDFKNLLSTLPFGDGARLVVLENLKESGVKAINDFNMLDFYGVVVAVVNPLKNVEGEPINCDHLDAIDIKKWLKNKFSQYELDIPNECYDYILGLSNGDMGYINSEIKKIFGFYEKGEIVKLEDLKMLLTKNENYFVYNLTNLIDKRDKKSAMRVLNSLQENISVGDIFTFLGPYFRKMFYIAISTDDASLAKFLRIKPYAIQKSREGVVKNGKTFYANLYNKYLNLDYQIKTGKITPINAIYSLILL